MEDTVLQQLVVQAAVQMLVVVALMELLVKEMAVVADILTTCIFLAVAVGELVLLV